jgi:hypothetical protein
LYDIRAVQRVTAILIPCAQRFFTHSMIEAVSIEERIDDYDVSETSKIFHRDYVFAF